MSKNNESGLRGRRLAVGLLLGATALLLAACGAALKVAQGDVLIKERLALKVDAPWNQFERGIADETPTWTNEGMTVDALKFYVGIRDGQAIAPLPPQSKGVQPLIFRAKMQPAEVVALYQSMLTADGSSFTLDKLGPADFLGEKGFRFEYTMVRKVDDVTMQGLGLGVIRQGELHLIHYVAPRLVFFARYKPSVEAIARSAQLRG